MPERITSAKHRFTFVEKSPGEVGSLTRYPVQVTRDQVAEIFYRVRDASWISGNVNFQYGAVPFDDHMDIHIPQLSRPAALIQEMDYSPDAHQSKRGFAFKSAGIQVFGGGSILLQTMVAGADASFGADYQAGAVDPADVWRDVLSKERGKWAADLIERYDPTDAILMGLAFHSHSVSGVLNDAATDGVYAFDSAFNGSGFEGADAGVSFSGEVAWVDVNGSGNPLDPLNELYLGVIFTVQCNSNALVRPYATTLPIDPPAEISTGLKFIIRLPSGDLSCDLALNPDDVAFTPYDSHTGTDFILEADLFWASAKNDPDTAVWNTATGVKL